MSPHPTKPWIAVVLSLIFGPLGFLYIGRPGIAVLFFLVTLALRLTAWFTGGAVSLAASVGEFVCWVGGAVLVWRLARSGAGQALRWYSRWYGLAGVVLATMLCLYGGRLFFYEPFVAPSSAMLPTAGRGDRLLVRKLGYGHLSVNGLVLGHMPATTPVARGDLVLFEDPLKPGQVGFKRVAGIGGDVVMVRGGRLAVNGRYTRIAELGDYRGAGVQSGQADYVRMRERLDRAEFDTLVQKQGAAQLEEPLRFPLRERCTVSREEIRCAVPPGYLFVLGDHRDLSQDSRYFGFVRADRVLGKVVGIYPSSNQTP